MSTATPTGLVLDRLVSGYRDLSVLHGLSLTVRPGSVHLVLGRNGAGKSTTVLTAAGLIPATRGTVHVDGRDVTRLRAHRRVGAGLGLVQENKRVLHQRTVEENLLIGGFTVRRDHELRRRRIEEQYVRFPILGEFRERRAGDLSGGQQQMLAIAQALMGGPSQLMLDEPSAGLAPIVVEAVFAEIRRLADAGLGVLLVEQTLDRALAIADEVSVVEDGRVVRSGDAATIDRDAVRGVYLGTAAPKGAATP
ncbi:ABC transporter ATP-binding protein [Pseudonocardia xishanensis]|uniref:ABC transporter ATP-binding protein n=1 Tax=Pseudonocardia xishanensis TaxID=630995 RepID=A0ABP8RTA3_9PSEU